MPCRIASHFVATYLIPRQNPNSHHDSNLIYMQRQGSAAGYYSRAWRDGFMSISCSVSEWQSPPIPRDKYAVCVYSRIHSLSPAPCWCSFMGHPPHFCPSPVQFTYQWYTRLFSQSYMCCLIKLCICHSYSYIFSDFNLIPSRYLSKHFIFLNKL